MEPGKAGTTLRGLAGEGEPRGGRQEIREGVQEGR